MKWVLQHAARYNAERAAIGALEAKPWFGGAKWRVGDDLAICVDADLLVGETTRPVTLAYPSVFPFAPPSVLPRGVAERWSGHQYGAGGELCLEFRPDNWDPTITGADMLRSAYKLLATEAGARADPSAPRIVPSAHSVSRGQTLRQERRRLLQTTALADKLSASAAPLPAGFRLTFVGRSVLAFVVKLVDADGAVWQDPEIPAPLADWTFYEGYAATMREGDAALDQLPAALSAGARELRALIVGTQAFDSSEMLVLALPAGFRAFLLDPADNSVVEYAVLSPDPAERSSPRSSGLSAKKIAVVGAGSVGSKVAASLARSGARNFLLVDDDILTPENMLRHELDWFKVGAHKVDAVADLLRAVRAGVDVEVRRQRLGGQEASSSLDEVLEVLAKCDIVVDASGSDTAFNYCASAAQQANKPMAWAKVFAGGYGGMIARSRPGLDPRPLDARAAIHTWCADPKFPEAPQATVDYGGQRSDGFPMVADDADVSVIAAHLARLVVDTLLHPEDSSFESSAYMIGLRKEWIFEAAFDTWPVHLGAPLPEGQAADSAEEKARAMLSIDEIMGSRS